MVADSAAQCWILRFDCINHRLHRCSAIKINLHLVGHARQRAEVMWKKDANHFRNTGLLVPDMFFSLPSLSFIDLYFSVWTSTDKIAGRSRTIGSQESPASADA